MKSLSDSIRDLKYLYFVRACLAAWPRLLCILSLLSIHLRHECILPQQLPGPAQPAVVGDEPQQEVSPGPGNLLLDPPESVEGAESIFLSFLLPQ